ncbi:unnamed protein product [Hydatigera taeniaeformis]|uniref:NR LBD domain-containing protein n=1 Tax=Hydatigena taeniaeformis TaxID=6205 RepID=A0A0R3WZ69_HYDTA|nr:unnamed protein product [Hydatigera taeniaeformis]
MDQLREVERLQQLIVRLAWVRFNSAQHHLLSSCATGVKTLKGASILCERGDRPQSCAPISTVDYVEPHFTSNTLDPALAVRTLSD